jgi:alanyl-tRNA synthetase
LKEARMDGAVALFGEKYAEVVRVISVGDYSKELCGGTHVFSTGEIGLFRIISETSSAAGIRRIEAVTGIGAELWVDDMQSQLLMISGLLKVPQRKVKEKLDNLLKQIAEQERTLAELRQSAAGNIAASIAEKAISKDGYSLIVKKIEIESTDALKLLTDEVRKTHPDIVVVLFAIIEDKVSIMVGVSTELTNKFQAGKLAGSIAAFVNGKGGGKPDLGMAGSKETEKVDWAIEETLKIFQ